jgi:selenium-binding protein 1
MYERNVWLCVAFDVFKDPRSPKLVHTVEPETIKSATGLSWPHTSHCLGTGEVVIR